jgi:shikimate kinase
MKIFLIGFMGSGKTSLGKKLTNKFDAGFIDTDAEISKDLGLSIPEIFEKYGESHFRLKERDLIARLEKEENLIVSTGGGLPCHNNLIDELLKQGLCIFLDLSPTELSKRIINSDSQRPLLDGLSKEEIVNKTSALLEERMPFYEKAQIILHGKFQRLPNVVSEINKFRKVNLEY